MSLRGYKTQLCTLDVVKKPSHLNYQFHELNIQRMMIAPRPRVRGFYRPELGAGAHRRWPGMSLSRLWLLSLMKPKL